MVKEFQVVALSAMFLLGFVLPAGAVAIKGPLVQVIEGAEKEGTVLVMLHSNFTPNAITRMEKGIKDKSGADLKIKFQPVENMSKSLAKVMMEKQAGIAPTLDIITLSAHVVEALRKGVVEGVDWKPLVTEDMNPRVVLEQPLMRGAIVYATGHIGLMYNPEKIKENEAPRTWADLARPKWKDRGGLGESDSAYARMSYFLGKEKIINDVSAIMKNGIVQGYYAILNNRYMLGEIWWAVTNSVFLKAAQDKGMPAKWQSLEVADVTEFSSVLLKGAPHPNAAKLVALYLASPEGAKLTVEEAGAGNMWYTGNYEHDITLQDQKQGIKERFSCRDTDILKFVESEEYAKREKEIRLILQTGGKQ